MPVRVLHLVASSRGGGAAHVRDLALGLDRARFAVQVAMSEDGGNVRRESFEAEHVSFHSVDIASGFSRRTLQRIRHLMTDADIVHVHGARAALFGRLAAATMRQRPRVVYTIHGFSAPHYPPPRRAILLAIEHALAPFTNTFIAVCEAERQAFLKAGITQPERVHVVRNGIDVDRFRAPAVDRTAQRAALSVPADALLVTTICRLFKPRDFDTLLRAFQLLSEHCPTAHLLIIGDGPLRLQVEHAAAALSLSERVTLAGWQSNLPSLYAASDIYTLTTWGWEGLPLTVLEAMAAGLPVVATRAGGIPEAVLEGETGLLVDRRDVSRLAEALQRLANDPGLRQRMGEAGRARARNKFTLSKMVDGVEEVYLGVRE